MYFQSLLNFLWQIHLAPNSTKMIHITLKILHYTMEPIKEGRSDMTASFDPILVSIVKLWDDPHGRLWSWSAHTLANLHTCRTRPWFAQWLKLQDFHNLAVKSTDKFSNFTYKNKLTRSNKQYTDLIAKLRKQAIKNILKHVSKRL